MKKTAFLMALMALLVLVALAPAHADEAAAASDLSLEAAAAALFQEPVPTAPSATCQANCTHGPDVSCSGSYCSAQDDPNGYVQCNGVYTYCAPPPVSVTIWIMGCNQIGDKAIYSLRANATGGNGSFSFSWSGANPTGGSTANPNPATTVVLSSKTVGVTASSGGASDYDSIHLTSPCSIIE